MPDLREAAPRDEVEYAQMFPASSAQAGPAGQGDGARLDGGEGVLMRKRKWIYAMQPTAYEIGCDKCNGSNITWSEYEHMIWCYDCKIDTPGIGGIFDGPIPLEISKIFGITFDRINLKTHKLMKMATKGDKIIYQKTNIDMRKKDATHKD